MARSRCETRRRLQLHMRLINAEPRYTREVAVRTGNHARLCA